MTRLDPQVKAVLVARLRERRAAGELTSAQVRRAAAEVGVRRVGERTLWGWLIGSQGALAVGAANYRTRVMTYSPCPATVHPAAAV